MKETFQLSNCPIRKKSGFVGLTYGLTFVFIFRMRRLICLLSAIFGFCSSSFGQGSHLLLLQQGDGAMVIQDGMDPKPLAKASFLPTDSMISVRPRSGIETLSSGFQVRFGAETRFMIKKQEIELNEGSLMIRSRKINNSFTLSGPESKIKMNGTGCFLVEVETNGGLKAVTVLGRLELVDLVSSKVATILPGELVFVMPGGRGFGEKVSVNLQKLIQSSYLVSGFPNNKSFQGSLDSVSLAQAESIGVTYGAEVGDAKSVDSFEVLISENENKSEATDPKTLSGATDSSSSDFTSTDPLLELLGRSPKRMSLSTLPTEEIKEVPSSISEKDQTEDSNRPFPSRLLRKN